MAVLTWRDVAAPNFSGVQDGYRNFSEMLNSAFGAAKGGLKDFDRAKTDAASSALMSEIAGAQTSDAAKLLADTALTRYDPRRISAQTMQALMSRPGDLTKQASAESDLNFTNYTRDKVHERDDALKLANPVLQQAGLLAGTGKMDEAFKVLSDNPEALGKLTPDEFFSQIKGLQGTVTGDTSMRSGRFSYENNVRDDGESRQAIVLQGIIRQNGVTPAQFEAYVNNNYQALVDQGISPVVIERARHAILNDPTASASFFENGTLPGGGGASAGGAAGGDPTRVMNYQAAQAGFAAVPESVKTLGQASDFAVQVNKAGVPSSAMGVYQIVGDTLRRYAPSVLGANWRNADFNFQNQDKIAQAIFNDNKGSAAALRKQWVSLSASDAERIRHLPWEQAREVIAQGESRTNVQQLLGRLAQDTVGVTGPQYNRSQDPGQILARGMLEAMGSDADPRTVAAGLAGEKGVLAGENVGNVAGVIKKIAQQYHISPAAAGLVLTKSLDANKNWYQRAGDNLAGIFGGGDGLESHIDWDQVEQFGKLAGNRDALLKQVTASTLNDASSQLVSSASQAASAAQAQAQAQARAAATLGRRVDPSVALAAAAQAEDLRGQAIGNSGAVTVAGGRQPAQAPKVDQRNVPQPKRGPAPAPARRAQAYLERVFQDMIPDSAGPVQVRGIEEQFKREFGASIKDIRSNPNLAWKIAKERDNKAAQLLRERISKSSAYFAR